MGIHQDQRLLTVYMKRPGISSLKHKKGGHCHPVDESKS